VSSKQHYQDTCKPKASRVASTTIWSLLRVRQSTNGAKGRASFVDLASFSTHRNVEHLFVRRGCLKIVFDASLLLEFLNNAFKERYSFCMTTKETCQKW
jgi:hypothetical protein